MEGNKGTSCIVCHLSIFICNNYLLNCDGLIIALESHARIRLASIQLAIRKIIHDSATAL